MTVCYQIVQHFKLCVIYDIISLLCWRCLTVNPFTHFAAICVWMLNPFSIYVHLDQMILIMIICVHYFSKILSPILSYNSCSPQGVNIHTPLLDKFLRYFGLYAASWVVKKWLTLTQRKTDVLPDWSRHFPGNMQLCLQLYPQVGWKSDLLACQIKETLPVPWTLPHHKHDIIWVS